MILKAFKYELNPNAEQVPLLNKTLGCARFIYNWGLNEKRKYGMIEKPNVSV